MDKLSMAMEDPITRFRQDKTEQFLLNLNSSNLTQPQSWYQSYSEAVERSKDPRVDDWLMMSSPVYTVLLCSLYLLIVLVIGPAFMKSRKPYSLKTTMMVYNLFQTLCNAWILKDAVTIWFSGDYNWICQGVDYSSSPQALLALRVTYWFYMSKFPDFFDSFFFILRKKTNQLSFLHVVHHATVPMFTWFGPKFAGGGNTILGGLMNMLIHVIMYFYYLLAAAGVRKEYLWWKRYLTSLQLVQFVVLLVHGSIPLVLGSCNYPKEMCYIIVFNGALYLGLFSNFYKKEYLKPRRKEE